MSIVRKSFGLGLVAVLGACAPSGEAADEGPTVETVGACPIASCGPGTVQDGDACVLETADGDFAAFTARTDLTMRYALGWTYDGARLSEAAGRAVLTDLSAANAAAWVTDLVPMIGTGNALQLTFDDAESLGVVALSDSDDCDWAAVDFTRDEDDARLRFVAWDRGVPTTVACATTGWIGYEEGVLGELTLTINAAFSDGSSWVDRVVTIDPS
jgi:hypothetical protein